MTEDYSQVIRERQVTVAEDGGEIVGLVVTGPADDGFLLDNVAVHPSHQGSGLGRTLLELAPRRDLDDPEREARGVDAPRQELDVSELMPLAGRDDDRLRLHQGSTGGVP